MSGLALKPPAHLGACSRKGTRSLASRAETSSAKLTGSLRQRSSGLDPIEIIIILGTFVCVFALLVLVGTLCKVFNRPSTEAHPYYGGNGLYHPSAAGYGGGPGSPAAARAAAAGAGGPGSSTNLLSVEQKYNARASLLGAASPMGAGGSGSSPHLDDSFGDSSTNSVDDYFGMRKPSAAAGPSHAPHGRNASSNMGHSRGESSGIHLPGPSAARRHGGGASGHHPAMPSGAPSPDGGGFRPGQVVVPAGYGTAGPGGPAPQLRAAPRGPPPAMDARRRSKYARADGRRIDSVGPGVLRKSMFLTSDDAPTDAAAQRTSMYAGGSRVQRQQSGNSEGNTSGGLRRVDSVGRGDARRRSQAYPAGAGASARTPSMYGALANDRAMMRSAQADNFGAGRGGAARGDPLGAARNNEGYESMDSPSSVGPPGAALKAGPRMPKQYAQQPSSYASAGQEQYGPPQPPPQLSMPPPGVRVPRAMGPPSPGIAPGMRMPPMGGYAHQAPLAAGGGGRQIL